MPPSEANWKPYRDLLRKFGPLEQDDVFRVLGAIQDAYGCIPREILQDVSERLHRPLAELYGAVTAYPGFRLAEPEADR